MLFDITSAQDEKDTNVQLTMEYEPTNLLGKLAIPLLVLDNAFALKMLLPYQLQPVTPLLKFQRFMGILYGIAGMTHFVDLVFGDSKILQLAGCLSFQMLPIEGQALALLWCAAGPLAFLASRTVGLETIGLIFYGLVEVACAALVTLTTTTTTESLTNALGVQALVAASYAYCASRRNENDNSIESDSI